MLTRGVNTLCLQDWKSTVHWYLVKMLGVPAKYFQDVSVLTILLFAAVFLSPELPMFWEVVASSPASEKDRHAAVQLSGRLNQCWSLDVPTNR